MRSNMTGIGLWTRAGAFALALACMAAPAAAQAVKVGFIDLARIERESASAVRASEALKKEFDPRTLKVQEFQKRIQAAQRRLESERNTLSKADVQARDREISEMMRQSNQMVERLSEEYDHRKGEYAARLFEEVQAAIKTVAESGKFDLIVADAIFAGPRTDITAQVIKEMARRGGAAR